MPACPSGGCGPGTRVGMAAGVVVEAPAQVSVGAARCRCRARASVSRTSLQPTPRLAGRRGCDTAGGRMPTRRHGVRIAVRIRTGTPPRRAVVECGSPCPGVARRVPRTFRHPRARSQLGRELRFGVGRQVSSGATRGPSSGRDGGAVEPFRVSFEPLPVSFEPSRASVEGLSGGPGRPSSPLGRGGCHVRRLSLRAVAAGFGIQARRRAVAVSDTGRASSSGRRAVCGRVAAFVVSSVSSSSGPPSQSVSAGTGGRRVLLSVPYRSQRPCKNVGENPLSTHLEGRHPPLRGEASPP
jgi:hypothetical protein